MTTSTTFKTALIATAVALGAFSSAASAQDAARQQRMDEALKTYRDGSTRSPGMNNEQMNNAQMNNPQMQSTEPRYRDAAAKNPNPGPAARAEEATKRGVVRAGNAVKDGAQRTGQAIKSGAQKAGNAVGTGMEKTGDAVRRGGEKLKDGSAG